MTVIDVHAHLVPPDVIDTLADRGRDFGIDLVETEPGCVERTEITWILANFMGAPVPLDVGISLAIDTIIKNAESLERQLDAAEDSP